MSERFCPECGARLEGDARYCAECGVQVAGGAQAVRAPQGRRPLWPLILLVGGGLVLLIAALYAGLASRQPSQTTELPIDMPNQDIPYPGVPRLPVGQAKELFDAGDAVFVDTRLAGSYEQSHIPGAVLLPADSPESQFAALPRDVPIVTYCT